MRIVKKIFVALLVLGISFTDVPYYFLNLRVLNLKKLAGEIKIREARAAVSYVGGQVGSFAGKTAATTVTFSLTNGSASIPAAGDLVVVAYSVGSTVDRALTIQNTSAVDYILAGSELYQNDTYDSNLRVAYRFMPGTPETQMVLSGTGSNTDAGAYTIHVFRGVDSGTPLDVAAVVGGGIDTRVANPNPITPITSGSWIYVAGAASGATGGAYTASYLTDFRAINSVDTNDAQIGAGYTNWTSGTYDPVAFSGGGTNTANDSWNGVTLALRPNDPPTISISQPDGTGDSVTAGDTYDITYSLSDNGQVVTAAFYYDSDNTGLNGTPITGACASAAEGSGATCTWDTTGVAAGSYYIYGITSDGIAPAVSSYSSGQIVINAANSAPGFSISQPDGNGDAVAKDGTFNITYSLSDPEQDVTAAFYYDTDNAGFNGVAIAGACASAAEGSGISCSWDTTGISPGNYYIYGIADDGTASPVSVYSPGQVTISSPPVLVINQPDGTADTLLQGQSFSIDYDLSDSDNVVSAAFYYDTDNSGLNGVALSGCASAEEGSGATCSWDTTGVPAGSYYIYGIVNDGINPAVSNYSSGQVTIDAPTVSVVLNSDGTVTYGTVPAGGSRTTITLSDTQIARNDGNMTESFNIRGQNTACPWNLSGTAGNNEYVHEFSVNGGANWTALTTNYQALATGVIAGGTKSFDLRITVPAVTDCFDQQSADVTIQAVQP